MFVGACEEEDIAANQSLGAGGDIGDEGGVAMADVGSVVDIVDRGGDVVRGLVGLGGVCGHCGDCKRGNGQWAIGNGEERGEKAVKQQMKRNRWRVGAPVNSETCEAGGGGLLFVAYFGFGAEHGPLEVASVFVDDDDRQESGGDEEGGALEGDRHFEVGGGEFSVLGLAAHAAFLEDFVLTEGVPGPEGEGGGGDR